jgi:hypothetical protein
MRRSVRTLALTAVLAAGLVLVTAGQAVAVEAKVTGPLKKVCSKAWVGNSQQSEACAILWWDASTQQLSAHCTVEYGFSGVNTFVYHCELQQGKRKTFESTAAGVFPGATDTSTANQTYTFSTPGVAKTKHQYSVNFKFEPSLGAVTGPLVQLVTPWVGVKVAP